MQPSPNFSNALFVTSCLEEKDFPSLYSPQKNPYPEIAIVGRSNAGKSSLINHLTQKKKLVFVSSTPGKTQLINFFNIDNRFLLVDLPGYGFAKVRQNQKRIWSTALHCYLENRSQLKTLILILDMRRELSSEDKQMIAWANAKQKKLLFVFSKQDKLSASERKKAEAHLLHSIQDLSLTTSYSHLCYSIKENQCRLSLKNQILSSLES